MTEAAPQRLLTRPSRWLAWTRLLLTAAILGAGYLVFVALHHGPVAGCGAGSGCSKVLQSRWAYWLDLPVSIPALLVYLTLLTATVLMQKRPSPDEQRGAWAAIISLSVVVAGAAAWFVGLQMFVIEAFCKFCLITHACGFTAAVLCLKNIPLSASPDLPMWSSGRPEQGVPRKSLPLLVMTGLVGVLVLVAGQMLVQKERNLVKRLPDGGARRLAAAPAAAGTNQPALTAIAAQSTNLPILPNTQLVAPRLLSIYNGKFLLQLDDVPVMGSPDASNVIVNLFDYNCTHCRMLHPILAAAQQRLSNQLAIVCLPMPMSSNCNPFVPPKYPSFSNSCDYARLSLAVWRADRFLFPQFDAWLFSWERPPTVDQVKEFASQLVGADKLAAALADPWIEQQIVMACDLHHRNWEATAGPAMPQIIIGDAVSVGELNSVAHLLVLLEKYLGLKIVL